MPMPNKMPKFFDKHKICIICEGNEEYQYLKRLKDLKVWNEQYDISLVNAGGNGNIPARYQDRYQNGADELVLVFCDTEKKPHEQYEDIKRKINEFHGVDNAAKEVIIFGNPCTMQIISKHWTDENLKSPAKPVNAPLIKKYTDVENYKGRADQIEEIMKHVTKENYVEMSRRVESLESQDFMTGHVAKGAKAVIAWGSCSSWGCINTAKPNPTKSVPITDVIKDKPIIRVPGCPPIPEVMTGVITYMLTYDRLPPVDAQLRPKMFYGQRNHDKCYRRAHFDAGQFVEKFDDIGAKLGYCLYKVGCKGPVTYNSCSSIRWNDMLSWPVESGHPCLACSEDNFWDKGSFYAHEPTILPPSWGLGIQATADRVGLAALGVMGAAVAVHAAASAVARAKSKEVNKDMGVNE